MYRLTWITEQLAVGHAPLSYEELDAVRAAGIDAIVNLCGEYTDLHEIEEKSGFEVYFLPVFDESAPEMEEMEQALAWLDEAIYLGKKVLVHCRHGIGRTGTFVTAYLLRKGLGLKVAGRKLSKTRANPTNYAQWRLLRKYSRQAGELTSREPSLASRHLVDLGEFFTEYEGLVAATEARLDTWAAANPGFRRCGAEEDRCCRDPFTLELIEAVYLANKLNRTLPSSKREGCIQRAVEASRTIQRLSGNDGATAGDDGLQRIYDLAGLRCPLWEEGRCLLFACRPLRCRTYGVPAGEAGRFLRGEILPGLSGRVFFALAGFPLGEGALRFTGPEVVSGRFVQAYFHYLFSIRTGH